MKSNKVKLSTEKSQVSGVTKMGWISPAGLQCQLNLKALKMHFGISFSLTLALCLLLPLGSFSQANSRNRYAAARTWPQRSIANPFVALDYYAAPKTPRPQYRSPMGLQGSLANPNGTDYEMFWNQDKLLLRHYHLNWLSFSQQGAGFYDNCRDIFKEQDFTAHVVKGVLDEITKRLEQLCADKGLHPLYPKVVGGSLYCDTSIQDTMDMLLDLLLDQVERTCDQIEGFQSIFLFSK